MKSTKQLLLGLALFTAGASVQAEPMEVVTVNSEELLVQSKRGQALRDQLAEDAKRLQEYQQQLSAELREQSESFQKNAKAMTPEAQGEAIMNLKMAERKAQRKLQEYQEDAQVMAQARQETVRRELISVGTNMLEEHNWGAMIDSSKATCFAANAKADVTAQVLEKADEQYEKELESRQMVVAQANSEAVSA